MEEESESPGDDTEFRRRHPTCAVPEALGLRCGTPTPCLATQTIDQDWFLDEYRVKWCLEG